MKQWLMVDMMSVMNVENYVGDDCSNEWWNNGSIQITNNDSDNDYCKNDTHDDYNDSNIKKVQILIFILMHSIFILCYLYFKNLINFYFSVPYPLQNSGILLWLFHYGYYVPLLKMELKHPLKFCISFSKFRIAVVQQQVSMSPLRFNIIFEEKIHYPL